MMQAVKLHISFLNHSHAVIFSALFFLFAVDSIIINYNSLLSDLINLLDELATIAIFIFAIVSIISRKTILSINFTSLLFFFIFIISIILSYLFSNYRSHITFDTLLISSILDIKVFILGFGVFALFDTSDFKRTLSYIVYISGFIVIVNTPFLIYDLTSGAIGFNGDPLMRRGNYYVPQGLFDHKVNAAQIAMICALGSSFLPINNKHKFVFLVSALFALFVTASVKEILGVFLGFTIVAIFMSDMALKKRFTRIGLLTSALVLLVSVPTPIQQSLFDRIDLYSNNTENSARTVLYTRAFDIAEQEMPLGVGPGLYGSRGARTGGYSPVYLQLGFDRVYGLSRNDPRFAMDGFWAKTLGEYGYLGAISFLLIVLSISLSLVLRSASHEAKFLMSVWLALFVISFASNPYGYSGLIIIGALAIGLGLQSRRKNHEA